MARCKGGQPAGDVAQSEYAIASRMRHTATLQRFLPATKLPTKHTGRMP